jgi:hypothetical protein
MLNATVHRTKAGFIFDVFFFFFFSFFFLFCIAKGLAICKFGGVISAECCTFKPFNLHMLIPKHCYLLDFVLFLCFRSNT